MRAIKSNNRMKQLMITISMLLFLFTSASLYSQQTAGERATDKAPNNSESVITLPSSQVGYDVLQSSPVKFDRNTLLNYSIPYEMDVVIKVYDKEGMELKTLVNELQSEGTHNINLNSAALKDGIYFYQLTIGNYNEVKKIMLVN